MIFGMTPVGAAEGAILAHAVHAKDATFKKGRKLTRADIAALQDCGVQEVMIARLEASDIAEDEAAGRIVRALSGADMRVGEAFTGRANLYAEKSGLAVIDSQRIAAANAVDEAITIATLQPYARVEPRQMLATVKIIPFGAPAAAVERVCTILGEAPAIRIAPFHARNAALISTYLSATKPSVLEKNRSALDDRLASFDSQIVFERRVPHDARALEGALREARGAGADPVLVFGASAITDRRDVIPAAIEAAGGSVEHFGMPVDPGNLLLLGTLDGAAVVGMPSCARSPKLNGFDFVLQRLMAGLAVGRAEIAAMGVGGLLTEIHTRPQPRDRTPGSAPHAPKIGAVILAAGLSSRMGPRNKLVAQVGGKPLLRRVAEAATASAANPVVLVTGNDPEMIEAIVAGMPVTISRNADFRMGLSTSLIRGINALPDDCDGAVILLGDMPGVTAPLIDKLIAAFAPEEGRAICVATHRGKRGNPVLWGRQFFADIRRLEGDVGAKSVIAANQELVCDVEIESDAPLVDIDTPEELAAYVANPA